MAAEFAVRPQNLRVVPDTTAYPLPGQAPMGARHVHGDRAAPTPGGRRP